MNEFTLEGKQGFIHLKLQEVPDFPDSTSHFGGYDARGVVEIKSGNYYVRSEVWFTTGEVFEFYQELKQCFQKLRGDVVFSNYDSNLRIEISFTSFGHFIMKGFFQERPDQDNQLQFEIESDQSYLSSTLNQLEKFVDYYGDLKGEN
ncbi:hypothetical protein LCL89_04870 [Halobacillus yeomjeoni]|uniref:WapI family immunity protein n=1 Tax=Halobacillus yeomjeoni TaxID=311194 RepID=UPI001CD24BE3|nr:hypothetical protein [Halobacillus yeomjeoni]MCA0983382.1 hypothetical protein [Halobacillus yeomjeoni]